MQGFEDRGGVSLWRQVGEKLIAEIEQGQLDADERLPSSEVLAQRFGVNRHTVLRAISHLQSEGYVRIKRGRGTYAVVNRLEYRIAPRRWFEENLLQSNKVPTRTIVSVSDIAASDEVAERLKISSGSPVFFLRLLGEADGFPVNFGCHYFPAKRLRGIGEAFRSFGFEPTASLSFTKVFASVGIHDFRRKHVRVRSRLPSDEEAWKLQMATAEQVLETEVTTVDGSDTPVVFAKTCFCSSRVELVMDL